MPSVDELDYSLIEDYAKHCIANDNNSIETITLKQLWKNTNRIQAGLNFRF